MTKKDGNSAVIPHDAPARDKNRCGATKRDGGACGAPAVKGGDRCKLHGGKSTGAKTGAGKARRNAAATKHGIYADGFTSEEVRMLGAVHDRVGSIDGELTALRIQFRRILLAQQRAFQGDPHGLELIKRHDREASEYGPGDEEVKERVDYDAKLDRCAGRIGMLEKTRAELLTAQLDRDSKRGGDDGPVTEFEVHIVTAENVHLYSGDADSEDE
ncbi:HGGxSTG domain-containing protein [Paraburkholderia oxyphila]|uniref:HGGxSTG domain-containing protein n=1 Tax=Paraburkholderia oxyphila TaxID=614212 RepID=UPI00157A9BDF|nr:HGGxSTG domain-containing protein [Paraburkholderia oxyphila]